MRRTKRLNRRVVLAGVGVATGVLLLGGLVGCQGDADTSASTADLGAPTGAEEAVSDGSGGGQRSANAFDPSSDNASSGDADRAAPSAGGAPVHQRAVISSASMALTTPDVGETRADVRSLLDRVQGLIAEEETKADDDGGLTRARLVLRVPSDAFDTALMELAELGEVTDESRSSEDVTTKVIDTETRVRAQQRSIKRIETLLDRAETLGQVVRVESELSRRQADLDSLLAQQAWLSEQSSLSTIALTLRAETITTEEEVEEAPAFLAGLDSGWGALTGFLAGLATATGAALPWLGLMLLLGVPVWAAVRAARRRRTTPAAA